MNKQVLVFGIMQIFIVVAFSGCYEPSVDELKSIHEVENKGDYYG